VNWRIVDKSKTKQPATGTYSNWKEILAEEGHHQCVYCTISESRFGGIRNFAVEHYKPKSLTKFKKLENDITNLFFACSICNGFKGNDWYDEPLDDFTKIVYPDPSKTDYSALFYVNPHTGVVDGKNIAGRYISEKLYLNRIQLILDRKLSILKQRKKGLIECITKLSNALLQQHTDNPEAVLYLELVLKAINSLHEVWDGIDETIPYSSQQIKRPS
jgi:hypothetical protein